MNIYNILFFQKKKKKPEITIYTKCEVFQIKKQEILFIEFHLINILRKLSEIGAVLILFGNHIHLVSSIS